jgi:hypothetical protein
MPTKWAKATPLVWASLCGSGNNFGRNCGLPAEDRLYGGGKYMPDKKVVILDGTGVGEKVCRQFLTCRLGC